jgi:hypothetical protein
MEHVHILAMLDEYTERLSQVRQLLLTLEDRAVAAERLARPRIMPAPQKQDATPSKSVQAKQNESTKSNGSSARGRSRTAAKLVHKDPLPAELKAETASEKWRETLLKVEEKQMAVEPERSAATVELQMASEPKREARRRRSAPVPRALGGMVSAAPVFISAEKVRQELTQKAEMGMKQEAAEEAPVTAELLTQRWVQGLVS